ncbi:RING finger and SPRY domain-containing protein 1 [Podila epicladia]|nr:RING finger and SPRY domain-containing protein 1 [Podila epicladia]
MVDMISTDSMGVAAPFLCHIIDMAALPSQQTTRRMSQQLLSKCDPGGLARLRSRKKNKPAAALIWSVLANRLAGEMSSTLFSDAVCECLLNNIEHDPDMLCKVFSIIALEKFSLTGPCKARIMQTNLQTLLRDTANMSTYGLTDPEEIAGITQAKFCAEWSLRNIFRDAEDSPKMSADRSQESPSLSQTENNMSVRDSLSPQMGSKRVATKSCNINVMLNTLDATRHWKVSEDGLSIRNDGSTFESIRATKSVTCGKWFYEVTLVTAGIMQLGWATTHCQFSPEEGTGVGDDIHGFSYDGCRNLIWAEGDSEPYGNTDSWKPGDTLGFYLDIDNAILECFVNGNSLGSVSPFSKEQFDIQASSGYFPAFSFTSFQQATVNFGATPFKYPPTLPWRNLNDHGTISPEMRKAIIRPRSDSVYGAILLDPVTGLRLPSMPEEEGEMDYSSLCNICCDHTATRRRLYIRTFTLVEHLDLSLVSRVLWSLRPRRFSTFSRDHNDVHVLHGYRYYRGFYCPRITTLQHGDDDDVYGVTISKTGARLSARSLLAPFNRLLCVPESTCATCARAHAPPRHGLSRPARNAQQHPSPTTVLATAASIV